MANWGAVGKSLIRTSEWMLKESFEEKAWARKQEVEHALWEERNKITDAQKVEAADVKYGRDLELKDDTAKNAMELAEYKQGETTKRSTATDRSRERVQRMKSEAALDKEKLTAAKEDLIPVVVETDLAEAKDMLKSINKQINTAASDGEEAAVINKLKQRRVRIKDRIDAYAEAKRKYSMGDSEKGAEIIGIYMQGLAQERQAKKVLPASNQ